MEMLSTFFVLILTVILLTFLLLKKKFKFWKNLGVETEPYSFLVGNMLKVLLQKESFPERTLKSYQYFKSRDLKHGGAYLMWVPMYTPIDIEIVKNIMQVDFQHFVDRGIYINEKADPLSAHLFSMEGKKWKLLRNKLSPTFTSGKLKMMFDTLVDCTKGLYKVMDNELGNEIDIKDIAGRFTTDIIGSCAFGIDCNSLENPNSEFREKGKLMFRRRLMENLKQFLLFIVPDFMKMFNALVTPQEVSDFFMDVVRKNVEYREKNNISRKDFMHLLIQLKNRGKLIDDEMLDEENITEDENKITLDEIAAQAFIFFEAGFETSSTTMTFCLYELAKDKIIQNKVREEIKNVLSNHGNKITYDAAMEMHYLEQTINETLRKYPPLPSLNRVCTKEYKVPGTDLVLKKGMRVFIPVLGIHRDADYYPEPEKFDPERFSEENKQTRPPFTFLPFGDGPRVCIGTRFGMMQTKVGLIALLLNYEFTVNKKTIEPLQFDPESFILSAKGGVWLNFEKVKE